MQQQGTSFLPTLEPRNGVLVADGYGVKAYVRRRHLIIEDGFGRERRRAEFARATSKIRRLVLFGHEGYLTLEALRWLTDTRAALVNIDRDGRVLASTDVSGNNDPRLRRAQALAMDSPVGLEIARDLIARKLAGQAHVAREIGANPAADEIDREHEVVRASAVVPEMTIAESRAAAAHFAAWNGRPVTFAKRDAKRVPLHWLSFGTRHSVLTSSPRTATDPANACLNFLYRLLEAEARLACLAVGLDPGLGIIHRDQRARDSMALDLMEAARPDVDRYLLGLLESHVFSLRDVHETRQGQCRLLPPFTHLLAETVPMWSRAVAPVAERVAGMLGEASGIRVATRLTQEARSKGRDGIRRGGRREKKVGASPPKVCRVCGVQIAKTRVLCDTCLQEGLIDSSTKGMQEANRRLGDLAEQGRDPRSSDVAAAKRRKSLARNRAAAEAFDAKHAAPDPEVFEREILPGLQGIQTAEIVRATGLSRQYAAMIRRGTHTPHPRHWEALSTLIRVRP